MKKMIIRGLALGTLALGVGVTTQQVSASAAYRTVKTHSYAGTTPAYHAKSATKSVYMWNGTLTKKLHNLKNYPKTTWYVQKSVKLTNGKKTGIFYYVENASNSVRGYVWRGYLTKGSLKTTTGTTNSTTATSNNSVTIKFVDGDTGATVKTAQWIIPTSYLKSGAVLKQGALLKNIFTNLANVWDGASSVAPTGYDIDDTSGAGMGTLKVGGTLTLKVDAQPTN
jgi:hypothetical protein